MAGRNHCNVQRLQSEGWAEGNSQVGGESRAARGDLGSGRWETGRKTSDVRRGRGGRAKRILVDGSDMPRARRLCNLLLEVPSPLPPSGMVRTSYRLALYALGEHRALGRQDSHLVVKTSYWRWAATATRRRAENDASHA